MFHTHRKMLLIAGLVLCLISTVFAYSGGSGTTEDPYQIGTVDDWIELMNTPSDWDANFVMIADINLQGVPLMPIGGPSPAGESSLPSFKGVFDGNGHVVRNASINLPGYWHIGLFGVIDSNSQIRNVGVEDVNMIGGRDTAGLVGLNNFGTISNCYATGKVLFGGGPNLGGLVGLNRGTITGSHAACDVNGGIVGGLVGRNMGGTILECYATGTVSGYYGQYDDVGGLVGMNDFYFNEITGDNFIGTIARCYATGSVSGNRNVGGLIGKIDRSHYNLTLFCSITDCYATGAVTGTSSVGGLVGNKMGFITGCYATGEVTGTRTGISNYSSIENFGGLIGVNIGPVTDCYATGAVTVGSRGYYVGGLMGRGGGPVTDCFATGAIICDTNSRYVGGLIGGGGYVTGCFATGAVVCGEKGFFVGGLLGDNTGSVTDCYATGAVTVSSRGRYVGGLLGNNTGQITNCYSAGLVIADSNVGGLIGSSAVSIK